MKQRYTIERFEDDYGSLEIRYNLDYHMITGHWKPWHGQTYHNTAGFDDDGLRVRELVSRMQSDDAEVMTKLINESAERLRSIHGDTI